MLWVWLRPATPRYALSVYARHSWTRVSVMHHYSVLPESLH